MILNVFVRVKKKNFFKVSTPIFISNSATKPETYFSTAVRQRETPAPDIHVLTTRDLDRGLGPLRKNAVR